MASWLCFHQRVLCRHAWKWLVTTPFGIVGAFTIVRDELLSNEWQQRLQFVDFLPRWHWAVWVCIFLVVLCVVVLESAYFDYARHSNVRRVKYLLRETADKAESLLRSKKATATSLSEWRTDAESMVAQYLGQPDANVLRHDIIDNQLAYSSPNEVPKEGHALHAGAGWLRARAGEITESDIRR
jgi:hypothetical protein